MTLTPQDLWTLRNILIRAVNETHEVLAAAVRRPQPESPREVPEPPKHTAAPKPRLTYPLVEAADLLGLSNASLYRLIARGDVKAVRIGSRRMIEAAEIEALLARARLT